MNKLVIGAIAAVVLLLGFAMLASANSKPYEDNSSPVMYFYSDQCSHCIKMKPLLTNLAEKGFRVKPMDVLKNPSYWTSYSIKGTPTWIAADGTRLQGEQTEIGLEVWLEAHGAKIK